MRLFRHLALTLVSLVIGFLIAETALRTLIFNDFEVSASLRDPDHFAENYSDDFWKLKHRWGLRGPRNPHPLLGWLKRGIDPETFAHRHASEVGARRPVLLYGDSFAQGVGAPPLDHFLNRDEAFNDAHYLLNYGVGGYGLDQIYLLFEHSVDRYDDPFVVFSLLVGDINRSMLSLRGGRKPYFELVEGELALRGVPIDADLDGYLEQHPPAIRSYFWNLYLYHADDPGALRAFLRGDDAQRRRIQQLNGALLDAIHRGLAERDVDYTFLVFRDSTFRWHTSWRDGWLRARLDSLNVEYIWAPDVLNREAPDLPLSDLFVPNGHPSGLQYELLAREIKKKVLAADAQPRSGRGTVPDSSAQGLGRSR